MSALADHPQRVELNDEVHARPPAPLHTPACVSYLALMDADPKATLEAVVALARRFDALPPARGATHYSADFGAFRLRWERHTEFARYMFIVPGAANATMREAFEQPALASVPADWLAAMPGRVIVGVHAVLQPQQDSGLDFDEISAQDFDGNSLIGSMIGGDAATVLTDARIRADGFSRLWVMNHTMPPGQAGRMLQRLLELETYRVMALLALPLARQLAPQLSAAERELAGISSALAQKGELDEPAVLERLTRLQAEMESQAAESHYRFGAAAAYYELVRRRIGELREERIKGLQTFQEFIERRLAPAMNTCTAISQRQASVSQRAARATQLLSTRVNVSNEQQNQRILESMNRRAALQLRLQQTVEGLSVAAGTYYIAGLIGYATKGATKSLGLRADPDVTMALAIPIVALLLFLAVRRIRNSVQQET